MTHDRRGRFRQTNPCLSGTPRHHRRHHLHLVPASFLPLFSDWRDWHMMPSQPEQPLTEKKNCYKGEQREGWVPPTPPGEQRAKKRENKRENKREQASRNTKPQKPPRKTAIQPSKDTETRINAHKHTHNPGSVPPCRQHDTLSF